MLGVWLIAGALSEIAFRTKAGKAPLGETLRRAVNLPAPPGERPSPMPVSA